MAEVLLYTVRRTMTLTGPTAVFVDDLTENWLRSRMAEQKVAHVVNAPSNPPGWTAGKWGEWYPDILGKDGKLTLAVKKPYWQEGWLRQHDRLLQAMLAMKGRVPLAMSGDLHAIAIGKIMRTGNLDLSANPVVAVLTGPVGTRPGGWPSSGIRKIGAQPSLHLKVDEEVKPIENHGFTLADCVSYNDKRNEANGENGQDGSSSNRSWNCGAEGPTDDEAVNALRERQMRNILATLMLAQGAPMALAGDEFGRTQQGNNNAYCQDDEISWVDWSLEQKHQDRVEYFRLLTSLRGKYPILHRSRFFTGESNRDIDVKDVAWINADGSEMTAEVWDDPHTQCLGMLMDGRAQPTPLDRAASGDPELRSERAARGEAHSRAA